MRTIFLNLEWNGCILYLFEAGACGSLWSADDVVIGLDSDLLDLDWSLFIFDI